MKNILNRVLKYTVVLSLLACLMTCSALSVMAATGVYVGDSSFNNGGADWTVDCYLYHNGNTSYYIDISSMAETIYNDGNYPVTQAEFRIENGTSSVAYSLPADNMPDYGVSPGSTVRVEVDWESWCAWQGRSTIINKTGSPPYIFTHMDSSYNDVWSCGVDTFWYATYYESEPF